MSHSPLPGTDGRHSPMQIGKGGWHSLERRLPLIMTGLLAVILIIVLAFTYATLSRAAREG